MKAIRATVLALAVLPLAACFESKEATMASCRLKAIEVLKPQAVEFAAIDPGFQTYMYNCMVARGYSMVRTPVCNYSPVTHNSPNCWESGVDRALDGAKKYLEDANKPKSRGSQNRESKVPDHIEAFERAGMKPVEEAEGER